MITKAKIEGIPELKDGNFSIDGTVDLDINKTSAVCAFCENKDTTNATIEFNFKMQRIYYMCGACKKMNELDVSKFFPTPYPRSSIGR